MLAPTGPFRRGSDADLFVVDVEPDMLLAVHPHALPQSTISVVNEVGRFGLGGSFICQECRQVRYTTVHACRACEFYLCPRCFAHLASEQQRTVDQLIAEKTRRLALRQASVDSASGGVVLATSAATVSAGVNTSSDNNASRNDHQALPSLLRAVVEANAALVKEIVEKNEFRQDLDFEDVADNGTYRGMTALLLAAERGFASTVLLLLNRGASKEAIDNNGMSPLMHAAYNGHSAVVDELLFAGVAVDRTSFGGYTALLFAASSGQTPCVKRLVGAGANVAAKTPAGRTPLIVAALNGHTETVRFLLTRPEAEPHETDDEGYTACDAAIARKHAAVERLLTARLHSQQVRRG